MSKKVVIFRTERNEFCVMTSLTTTDDPSVGRNQTLQMSIRDVSPIMMTLSRKRVPVMVTPH